MTAGLAAALLAAADGIPTDMSAAGLLIGSGAFLRRPDFASFIETAAGAGSGAPMAWIDWDAAVTALDRGRLPASSGEKAVLRLAASLASGNRSACTTQSPASTAVTPPACSPPSAGQPDTADRPAHLKAPAAKRRGLFTFNPKASIYTGQLFTGMI